MTTQLITTIMLDAAIQRRQEAQAALTAARRALTEALNAEVRATAAEYAARGGTYDRWLGVCLSNAKSNGATWSGGPDSSANILEAASREAWMEVGADFRTQSLFGRAAQ